MYNKMDRGQTYDVVDTPPKDRRHWPALEDFQERAEISKWCDIQLGIYKVLEVQEQGFSNYGASAVLKLEHENGPIMFVWASLYHAMNKRKSTDYILNLEAKVSGKNGQQLF